MNIISNIDFNIKISNDLIDQESIREIFRVRYLSNDKSKSKFSAIGESIDKNGQTIRSVIIKSWAKIKNIDEIIALVESDVRKLMKLNKTSSISYNELANQGSFIGMSSEDVRCFMHDLFNYVPKSNSALIVVRKGGKAMLSSVKDVDSILSKRSAYYKKKVEPSNGSVDGKVIDLAKKQLLTKTTLANDFLKSNALISPQYSRIIEDRCGLISGQAKTLAEVGKVYDVTRERIRQTTVLTIKRMLSAESVVGDGPLTRMLESIDRFDFKGRKVVNIDDLIASDNYLSDFTGNAHGLFLLISACGIENVIQNSGFYIHVNNIGTDHALHEINKLRESNKAVKTKEEKHQMMAIFPESLKARAKAMSLSMNISSNSIYESLIKSFVDSFDDSSKKKIKWDVVEWDKIGGSWKMVNLRLPAELIKRSTEISDSIIVDGKSLSRTSFVYNVINQGIK